MKLKLGIILYMPPPRVGYAQVFFDHLQSYKRSSDLILYSEHEWPGALKMRASPEDFKDAKFPSGEPNQFGVPNAAFFTGLRIAYLNNYSHVIALEPDVRVGIDYWDGIIWEEYFGLGFPAIAAGTLACYNSCNWNPTAAARWSELVSRNNRKNFPIASYGHTGAGKKGPACVFPNGALAVYDMAWMAKFFDLDNTATFMAQTTAWDMAIGVKIWDIFAEDSYNVVGHLESIYSGFGNVISTEEQRRELLTGGEVVAIHQVKSDWVPEAIRDFRQGEQAGPLVIE